MTLEQLRIFVAVAEREHMTRAAEALNVTQSAASAAIAVLEGRHGVALFDRVGRGIALTEAGRQFLAAARGVLAAADEAEQALSDIAGLKRGRLRLAASHTLAGYWLPRHLAAFHERYPGVEIDLALENTEGAARRLRDGRAELAFVEGVVEDPALEVSPVSADRLLLVSAHPAARFEAADLRAARWVMREPGSGTRSSFERVLVDLGLDPNALDVALVAPSNEAVRSAVEAGAGIAALSSLVVETSLTVGALHALPFALPERPLFALRRRDCSRSRASAALLDLIGAPS
ncbi:LysR family transcriptional regulator [Caulobacter mirabilis]|uniref:LysR family transcriptional regulator n=1 Tax=Caulobacter mirabilis TaxID=69666 RepID=A0A2D2AXG1_9CAUL|nr:LysR family transcriptional regulator [Caulobacter mirabilis]ATQ42699.1 LysR family transcriptional regulator [Caulobacter mirabilis]